MASRNGPSHVVNDVWSIAENDPEIGGGSGESMQSLEDGSTVLLIGDSGCGKSSLIQSFLKPNSSKDPKPTFALEYNFARRKNAGTQQASSSSSSGRSVAHLWELGGGIFEPKLLEIPLSVKNIPLSSVIIVCDLSKPKNVLASLKRWISLVRDIILGRLTAADPTVIATLKESAVNQYGPTHADIARVRPCEVPIVIIGNKLDMTRSMATNDRRTILQVMRFVAHYHGASLILSSNFERDAYRSLMNSVCFGLPVRPVMEVAVDKAAHVTAGMDDFSSILLGIAPGEEVLTGSSSSRLAYSESDIAVFLSPQGLTRECWGRLEDVLTQTFGAPDPEPNAAGAKETGYAVEEGKDGHGDAGGDSYPEAEVDEMRAQRDAALSRYVAEIERRDALNAPSKSSSSSSSSAKDRDEGVASDEKETRRGRK